MVALTLRPNRQEGATESEKDELVPRHTLGLLEEETSIDGKEQRENSRNRTQRGDRASDLWAALDFILNMTICNYLFKS